MAGIPPPATAEQHRKLWVGGIETWMDEEYLWRTFSPAGPLTSARIIRDKARGLVQNFAFVEFARSEDAARLVQRLGNEFFMAADGRHFKVNWANAGGEKGYIGPSSAPEFSLYVGNLDPTVTEDDLLELFSSRFKSVYATKVVHDIVGHSKGFGFVRFHNPDEAEAAITSFNGVLCRSKCIRVKPAQKPDPAGGHKATAKPPPPAVPRPTGGALWLTGLGPAATESTVVQSFQVFGALLHVLVFEGRGCALLEFSEPAAAAAAMRHCLEVLSVHAQPLDPTEALAITREYQCFESNALQAMPAPILPPSSGGQWKPATLGAPSQIQGSAHISDSKPELESSVGRCTQVPSFQHFQALLQHSSFVEAFERQLVRNGVVLPYACQGAPDNVLRLPWLLQDRPELFDGKASVEMMNQDFLPANGGGRELPLLACTPLYSSLAEVGVAG